MIDKLFRTNKSFAETCEYLCQDQSRSQVLAAEGVRTHDYHLMAQDFEWQHRMMPDKEKAVFHSILSFPPGERPKDAQLVEIAQRYLQKIEMVNTQYALVKHTDKAHLHVHIIANKVNNDGRRVKEDFIYERSLWVTKELTREYGFRPENGKHLDLTHPEALPEPDAKRYRIYTAIREQLPESRSLEELEERLLRQEISMRYRVDAHTGKRLGVSFHFENRSFKGSRIDKDFSLKGLERTLVLQERRLQEEKLKQSLTGTMDRLAKGRPGGWDDRESMRRRQELKDRLDKAEEERLEPKLKKGLEQEERLRQEEDLQQDLRHEQRQVQRRGLRL
jgi:hypothetical protein